jgi:hypothetical protein
MLVLLACEDPNAPEAQAEPNRAETDRLVALGYHEHAEETADPRQMRVVEIDRERSQPGYRLYCTNRTAIAELIDVEGRPVHSWSAPDTREFMACLLLDYGDILIVGVLRPTDGSDDSVDSDRYLARYAWDGRMKWRRAIPVHHHVSLTPDGKLASLGLRYREIPEVDATVAVRDDEMLLLDPDGHVIEERSIYDALASAAGQDRFLPIQARKKWGVDHVDLIHANTIEWMRHEHLVARSPLYAPGNVLVTLRHQNLVAIIEWASNRVVWAWGREDLVGPHEGTVLPTGNILIFDNGGERGWSRVIELDPMREEITWEYRAPKPADFFSAARGGSERLPNGNTLITNSNSGHAFEVSPEGETVWRFMNPHLTPEGKRLVFRRMSWYPAAQIDAILERERGDPAAAREAPAGDAGAGREMAAGS